MLSRTPAGIGKVTKQVVATAGEKAHLLDELRQVSESLPPSSARSPPSPIPIIATGSWIDIPGCWPRAPDRQRVLLDQLGLYGPA